jgi:hypothetical protein
MNITLGSLLNEHLHALQELDLLPQDTDLESTGDTREAAISKDATEAPARQQEDQPVTRTQHSGRTGGLTWFEEMLEGSQLGRTQNTRRGVGVSDGSTVEWEVAEYYNDGSEVLQSPTGSKRKIGDVGNDDDVSMQH